MCRWMYSTSIYCIIDMSLCVKLLRLIGLHSAQLVIHQKSMLLHLEVTSFLFGRRRINFTIWAKVEGQQIIADYIIKKSLTVVPCKVPFIFITQGLQLARYLQPQPTLKSNQRT